MCLLQGWFCLAVGMYGVYGVYSERMASVKNEEKILEILTQMHSDVSDLKQGQAETNQRLDKLETAQDSLVQGQAETNQRMDKLEQGQAETNQRLDKLEAAQDSLVQGQAEANHWLDKIKSDVADQAADLLDLRDRVNDLAITEIAMSDDVRRTRAEVTRVRETVTKIENEHGQHLAKLEQGQSALEADLTRVRETVIKIENEHHQRIGFLADGHTKILERLDPLQTIAEALQEDVSVIKAVVSSHSRVIKSHK